MKVLHIINSLAIGGAEKLIIDTIPIYNTQQIKADLLLLNNQETPFLKNIKQTTTFKIYSLGSTSVYNPINIFKIIPYLKKYNIIHVHLFPSLYWVALAKIISLSKTRIIFTEHSTSNRRLENKFFRIFDKFIYKQYACVICITPSVANSLNEKLKISTDKLVVIENGVNINTIKNAIAYPKNQIIPTTNLNDKWLIQVAGFRVEKDQPTAIKAMLDLPTNIKLLLVGTGVLQDKCKHLVNTLGLQDRVFFLGQRIDIPELLKTADVVIVSSHWEGFGLAAVEGMAAQKPVIATNVHGLASVVSGAGILFEKQNNKQLAQIIIQLLTDKNRYDQVAKNCKERATQYDIQRMIDKTVKLYI